MAVVCGNAWRLQAKARAIGRAQHVNHQIAGQMSALEQHRRRAQRQQVGHSLIQRVNAFNRATQQQRGLIQIGRHYGGQRKQRPHQHLGGFWRNQPVATGGHHDRVQHDLGQAVAGDGVSHQLHHVGCGQHADLDGVHANVIHHSIDLPLDGGQRDAVDAGHAQGVLHRDGGNGRHAIAAQGAAGFEVSLDTGTAAAIRAGDGQHSCIVLAGRGRGSLFLNESWRSHDKNYRPCARCSQGVAACAVMPATDETGVSHAVKADPKDSHTECATEKHPGTCARKAASKRSPAPDPGHAGVGSFKYSQMAHLVLSRLRLSCRLHS